jgi:hypothetical protein
MIDLLCITQQASRKSKEDLCKEAQSQRNSEKKVRGKIDKYKRPCKPSPMAKNGISKERNQENKEKRKEGSKC